MYQVTRRQFLKALGAGAALSAGGIALIEVEPIVRSYFLPPRGGWPGGPYAWEIAIANEALRILNGKLGLGSDSKIAAVSGAWMGKPCYAADHTIWVEQPGVRDLVGPMLARRARLIERVDKLSRGWKGFTVKEIRLADGTLFKRIHGGRS